MADDLWKLDNLGKQRRTELVHLSLVQRAATVYKHQDHHQWTALIASSPVLLDLLYVHWIGSYLSVFERLEFSQCIYIINFEVSKSNQVTKFTV